MQEPAILPVDVCLSEADQSDGDQIAALSASLDMPAAVDEVIKDRAYIRLLPPAVDLQPGTHSLLQTPEASIFGNPAE